MNFQLSLLQLHTKSLCVLALQNSQFEASTSSRPQTVNFEALGHKAILDTLCRWSARWQLNINLAKCKVHTLTQRRVPTIGMYTLRGEQLERASVMRDLSVVLNETLTFSEHVDATVRKANRAIGVLMGMFQTDKRGRYLRECNVKAVLVAYCANVRSILEFAGSMG